MEQLILSSVINYKQFGATVDILVTDIGCSQSSSIVPEDAVHFMGEASQPSLYMPTILDA